MSSGSWMRINDSLILYLITLCVVGFCKREHEKKIYVKITWKMQCIFMWLEIVISNWNISSWNNWIHSFWACINSIVAWFTLCNWLLFAVWTLLWIVERQIKKDFCENTFFFSNITFAHQIIADEEMFSSNPPTYRELNCSFFRTILERYS